MDKFGIGILSEALCITFIASVTLVTLFGVQHVACAAAPTTACDPEFMDALEARAFLEAQREISQNQNLILKPDSVLEYTCFDKILQDIAGGGTLPGTENFSESLIWGGVVGQNAVSLDTALLDIISAAYTWDFSNFSHQLNPEYNSYLHNRAGPVIGTYDMFDVSTWDALNPFGGSTSFACTQMAQVWNLAQCADFMQMTRDGFHDFSWFVGDDPRMIGNTLSCASLSGGAGPIDQIDIDVAFNDQGGLYMPNNNPYDDTTFYDEDPVVTYLNLILPLETPDDPATPNPGTCQAPIPTGLCVSRTTVGEYADAFCPNPGCYYQPSPGACNSVGTCVDTP